jgi:site-specific DNA recombinase
MKQLSLRNCSAGCRRKSPQSQHLPARLQEKGAEVKGKYNAKYALSDIMVCAECGQPYRRQVWSKYGQKRAVWRCDNRLKHGSKRWQAFPNLKGRNPA